MAKKSEYAIGFTGLSDGLHLFTFEIGKLFFEAFENTEIKDGKVSVALSLEKKPNMMLAHFDVGGDVVVMCDRCTDDFYLPVKGEYNLVYKFADEDYDDENIITVLPSQTSIDIAQTVYEFITLLLPTRRLHPKGKCNEQMLADIDKYLIVEEKKQEFSKEASEGEVDPRWAALEKLKNNKNKK